jgi:hypothetical protein
MIAARRDHRHRHRPQTNLGGRTLREFLNRSKLDQIQNRVAFWLRKIRGEQVTPHRLLPDSAALIRASCSGALKAPEPCFRVS